MSLRNKKILLCVSAGIAAYKSVELVRRLREQGCEIRVAMSEHASEFVTSLTFQAVSGHEVVTQLFNNHDLAMPHIDLARWADFILVAPATADVLARIAHGFADALIPAICLVSEVPVALVPSMNRSMWENPATIANIEVLKQRQYLIWGPDKGNQACGEVGLGRMLEPEAILAACGLVFSGKTLTGKKILVTAGPTREAIDPVRFLSNRSSGRMGFAMARAAAAQGADVILVAGPVSLSTPIGVTRVDITSANEMYKAVIEHLQNVDIFISVAAVADYRPIECQQQKINKSAEPLKLTLEPTVDILGAVADSGNIAYVVGFAAETEHLAANAKKKLAQKRCDLIVANKVGSSVGGFETEQNAVTLYWQSGELELPLTDKSILANNILECIVERYDEKNST